MPTAISPCIRSGLPRIRVAGSNREIGLLHGRLAQKRINRAIAFYKSYFEDYAHVPWNQAVAIASRFIPYLSDEHSDLLDELQGIAEGSGHSLGDILALNARSEIALSTDWTTHAPPLDGCTSFAWNQDGKQWSGQNWDWKDVALEMMIVLEIDACHANNRPAMKMITEAGVIGKIGLNENGVCTMLNALRVPKHRFDALPVHLLLRRMLESSSVTGALDYITAACHGVSASTANVVLADPSSAVSIELHPTQSEIITADPDGFVLHTNHLLKIKDDTEIILWPDSMKRVQRLSELTRQAAVTGNVPGHQAYRDILSDRSAGETSICRFERKGITTVFSIAVDCDRKRAEVKIGRPDEGGELMVLDFLEMK